jgi:curved DNA-binding protein CbpA
MFHRIAPYPVGEITLYEEIGVAPDASPDEIRTAFRALVRLFHPDRQTDPQLRDIAEKQMRKLNRVYAVLSDPERRRRYDEVPEREYGPRVVVGPVLTPGSKQFVGRAVSFGAILFGVGLTIWFLPDSLPAPQGFAHDETAFRSYVTPSPSAGVVDQDSLLASLQSDLTAVTRERSAAIRELNQLRGTAPEARFDGSMQRDEPVVEAGLSVVTITPLPTRAQLPKPADSQVSTIEKAAGGNLAGFWFYAKPPEAQDSRDEAVYLPDRVEATIQEQNGRIYGRYHERFPIAGGILPDVTFAFKGTLGSGPQYTFPWTGPAGEKGELALKVISVNSLRIDWHASEQGSRSRVEAGTAILTRRPIE